MRGFLRNVAWFALLQIVVVWSLSGTYTAVDSTNYLAEAEAKHARLHTLAGPRVVLVGGSSAAFGYSSALLERELGLPVVNMGLMAGLGVEFMLAEVRPRLKAGDTVVFSFEYEHFARKRARGGAVAGFDPDALEQVLEFRPSGVADLGWSHVRRLVSGQGLKLAGNMARRLARCAARALSGASEPIGDASARRGFNAHGDFIWHRGPQGETRRPAVGVSERLVLDAEDFPNRRVMALIAAETRRLRARGVRVTWSFPPRPAEVIRRQSELAGRLEEALRAVAGLEVLDTPAAQSYPLERFYDSENHLDGRGADERTTRLARSMVEGSRRLP